MTIDENLDGWACYLADPNVQVQDVWRVEDGVIACSGKPLGYLYTKKDFRDFVLKLQWLNGFIEMDRCQDAGGPTG